MRETSVAVSVIFSSLISNFGFLSFLLLLLILGFIIVMRYVLLGTCPSFFAHLLRVSCTWIKDKFIKLAIRVLGFEKVYKLGWARPGVDFFDCGVDCAKCPNYGSCDSSFKK